MAENNLLAYLNSGTPQQRYRSGKNMLAEQFNRSTPQDGSVVERAGLVPLGRYENGQVGFAFPGLLAAPVEAFGRLMNADLSNPREARHGDDVGTITPHGEKSVEDVFDVAGGAMVGGLLAPRPKGSLGMSGRPINEPRGITAYHGSPHDFDKVDKTKFGSGFHGHGFNVTTDQGLAEFHKNKRTGKGNVYEVNVRDVDQMIDGTKAVNQQPAQIAAKLWSVHDDLREAGKFRAAADLAEAITTGKMPSAGGLLNKQATMGDIVTDSVFVREVGGQKSVADLMTKHGIGGAQYMHGDKTKNITVFDDKLVEILRKYGLLGMLGGGALAGSQSNPNGGT